MYSIRYPRYEIRPLTTSDKELVKEVVYQAIYVPKDHPPPTRAIFENKDIKKYYQHWGRKGDYGLALIHKASEQPVGGVFIRYYPKDQAGYGFVSEAIPELSIGLLPDHRDLGQGTRLLNALMVHLKGTNCQGVSLSVDAKNRAYRLYKKLGFKTVREQNHLTMLLSFISEPFT